MTPPAAEEPPRGAHHHPDLVHDLHDVHVVDHNGRQISAGGWVCCMPCYWLRTNTSVHKASLTVVTLLVTSLLVASPVLFLISSVPANEQPYKDCTTIEEEDCFVERNLNAPIVECDTAECKDIARRIQFSLSWNHDPCKDFYKFACGSWTEFHKFKNKKLRSHYGLDLTFYSIRKTVESQIQRLLTFNATTGRYKKLGLFYTSCLMSFNKQLDISPMYMMLDKIGGYLPPGSLGPNDITFLITNILKANGTPLLDIYLDRDFKNKSVYAIIIDLPKNLATQRLLTYHNEVDEFEYLHLKKLNSRSKREETKENTNSENVKEKHVENDGIIEVVAGMLPKGMKPEEKAADIQQISSFAAAVEKLIPSKKELKEHLKDKVNSEAYSIEKLQEEFPSITWKILLKDLLGENEANKRNIYVISRQYMSSVSQVITRFQKRIIQNALLAMYARDYLYIIANHTFFADNRNQFCTQMTIKCFAQPISALYLSQYNKHYLDELNAKVADMFLQLKRGLFSRVEKVTWLDSETKWKAMDKLTAMTAHFIAWPLLRNQTFVDEILSMLNVTDDFFENVVIRYYQIKQREMMVKDKNIVNLSWPYPFVVNAFYETDDNSIVVPLALLTQPHFSRAAPEYISYGTIGNVIAHEMLHALDFSTAHQNPAPLWAKSSSLSALNNRLNCLVTQYQSTTKKDFKIKFDGNATRLENAADIGGVRVSWVAWRNIVKTASGSAALPSLPLSPAKLFYLTMAQLYCTKLSDKDYVYAVENDFHSTAAERVNGLVKNSPAFGEVYQCPIGSPMNPVNKCIIW